MLTEECDAIVIGSGPNGLAAAITLAESGLAVVVLEASPTLGGGTRTQELTLPGFRHDVCSSIHPLAVSSPFFRRLPLGRHGLTWVYSPAALAHPLDDGRVAVLDRSIERTATTLSTDSWPYRRMMVPLVRNAERLFRDLLSPLALPRHPVAVARFGLLAVRSAEALAETLFDSAPARALLAGCAAHSFLPLDAPLSSATGLVLLMAGHAAGWPCARGGSQAITEALVRYFELLGGTYRTDYRVRAWSDLPKARVVLFDTSPGALAKICGHMLPERYRTRLARYRHAPGVFKLDWALDGPIPWRAPRCASAATVHLGGTLEQITASEAAVHRGELPDRPFVIVAQPSLFDETRAPTGKHTAWAYCHVPYGSTADRTDAIERQIEQYAPGFRDRILARHAFGPADLARYNDNYEGGDIAGGSNEWRQFYARPVSAFAPYATPIKNVFLCSSSTPPGAGVHGLCGQFAAGAALSALFGRGRPKGSPA